jgi:hypothetical protein
LAKVGGESGILRNALASVFRISLPSANPFGFCDLATHAISLSFPRFAIDFRFSWRDGTRNDTRLECFVASIERHPVGETKIARLLVGESSHPQFGNGVDQPLEQSGYSLLVVRWARSLPPELSTRFTSESLVSAQSVLGSSFCCESFCTRGVRDRSVSAIQWCDGDARDEPTKFTVNGTSCGYKAIYSRRRSGGASSGRRAGSSTSRTEISLSDLSAKVKNRHQLDAPNSIGVVTIHTLGVCRISVRSSYCLDFNIPSMSLWVDPSARAVRKCSNC